MPPKEIYLIRHAQGYHNLSLENHNIHDPLLTPYGIQQSTELASTFPDIQSIDCIVSSPIRRALYTALFTFKDVLKAKPHLKIIAISELQETSATPCDTGSPLEELLQEFKGQPIDFSHIRPGWENKIGAPNSPRVDHLIERCSKARRFLRSREEEKVAVVTHGSLLHFVTDDWMDSIGGIGTGWTNAEFRTYTFDSTSEETIANATLLETRASITRRAADIHRITPAEQLELRAAAYRHWAANGWIDLPDATTTTDCVLDHGKDVEAVNDAVVVSA